MSSQQFYLFNDMIEDSDAGFPQSQIWKLPMLLASWISGAKHIMPIPDPIEVELNPEFSTELIDAYHEEIPIWSTRLIQTLQNAGVNNLDLYDAVVRDPRTNLETKEYKAVNIIGNVDCVDMEQSKYDERSEQFAREFETLVIDPDKVHGLKMFRLSERPTLVIVNEDVKNALEAANLRGVRIDPLMQVA